MVTGSGNGIGEAIAKRFAVEGAEVLVTDIEEDSVARVAADIGTVGFATDITVEANVRAVVARAEHEFGPIDIWHSNAGVAGPRQPAELQDDATWDLMWRLHVMSHVYAARAVLPSMLERGDGYLLQTASQVAFSTQIEKVAYAVTKRGAVALSEWLAVHFRPRGIKVSCFCPGPMLTRILLGNDFPSDSPAILKALTPAQVADIVVQGIRAERFLIVTVPDTEAPLKEKAADYDAWIGSMLEPYGSATGS